MTYENRASGPLRMMFILSGVFVCSLSCAFGQVLAGLGVGRSELKGLRIPIGADPAHPSLMLLCGSVRLKPREIGIFRIGFAMQTVLRGLELQIPDEGPGTWAAEMGRFLSAENFLRSSEVLDFRISDTTGRELLSARRGRVVGASKALLLENVVLRNRSCGAREYPQVLLSLAGDKSGRLSVPETPDRWLDIGDLLAGD